MLCRRAPFFNFKNFAANYNNSFASILQYFAAHKLNDIFPCCSFRSSTSNCTESHTFVVYNESRFLMDLTSLLAGAGPGEMGPSKTNTMEELRQSQYKRTGAKTATERRTLRSIQVFCFRSRLSIIGMYQFSHLLF